MSTPNLGVVITNARARRVIYGAYVIALVIAGAAQAWFAALQLAQPSALVGALAVLAYLGIPVGALALANTGTPPAPFVPGVSLRDDLND
jgi:hypothetical protein